MKVSFDISMRPQIESGEYKVETSAGCPVKYVGINANEKMLFEWNGIVYPEKELSLVVVVPDEKYDSEFEEQLASILNAYNGMEIDVRAAVKANVGGLLYFAKEELLRKYDATEVDEVLIDKMSDEYVPTSHITAEVVAYRKGLTDMYKQFAHELEKARNSHDSVSYKKGYDAGLRDTEARFPRWKKIWNSEFSCKDINNVFLVNDGYEIKLSELIKLPKDE